jgi:DNA mismatch endonuclease (patch repair protein)
MARIRGKETGPEKLLREVLSSRRLRYRLNYKTPFGRADLALPSVKVAVFVDGCFWHGCPEHYVRPRSRVAFWSKKLRDNVKRDIWQTSELEAAGWKVCRAWEHEVETDPEAIAERVERAVGGRRSRRLEWRVTAVRPKNPSGSLETRHLVELRGRKKTRALSRARSTRKWRRRK